MNDFFFEVFGFQRRLSAPIIKLLYVLGLIAITLGGLQQLFNQPLNGFGLIIVGNLLWRIFCESLILLFKIHEELVKISCR